MKKIRKILKIGYIPDKPLINAVKIFDSKHGTTDIINLLITEQENDLKKVKLFLPLRRDPRVEEFLEILADEYDEYHEYDSDLDESYHEQYYDYDEEYNPEYDSDLNVETHINPYNPYMSKDDYDLENYQWGIWMYEMGKVNVEIRSYAKGTGNIIGILKINVETDINSSDSSANCQNSSDSSSKGSSSGYTIREDSENYDIDPAYTSFD